MGRPETSSARPLANRKSSPTQFSVAIACKVMIPNFRGAKSQLWREVNHTPQAIDWWYAGTRVEAWSEVKLNVKTKGTRNFRLQLSEAESARPQWRSSRKLRISLEIIGGEKESH